jgi:hypothetical protein
MHALSKPRSLFTYIPVALVLGAAVALIASCSGSSGGGNGNSSSSGGGSSGGGSGSGSGGGSGSGSGGSGSSSGSGSGSGSSSGADAASSGVLTVALVGDGSGHVVSNPPGIDCTTGSATGCSYAFGTSGSGPIMVSLSATPSATSSYAGQGGAGGGVGNLGCNGQSWATTCPYEVNDNGLTVDVNFSAWLVRQPFPATAAALAASAGTMVVVGAGSAAATSTDGASWTGHVLPQADLDAVAAGAGGLFVAAGNAGAIVTTSDASTWTSASSGTTEDLTGIAYGASTFVVVGKAGTVEHSADGATWSTTHTGATTTQDLLAVTYGGGLFVATGYAGTILTSPDGAAWTQVAAGVTTQYLTAVTYGGTQYVAVGSGGVVLSSPDAVTWKVQPSTGIPSTQSLRGVAWSGTTFVAAGDFTTGGSPTSTLAFTSTDGVTWTQRNTSLGSGCGSCGELFLGVAYAGGSFYALGNSDSILRSSDGVTWTQVMAPTGRGLPGQGISTGLGAVTYGESLFVAAGGPYLAMFSSSDGSTWTSRHVSGCCGGNNASIAFGSWTTPSAGSAFVVAAENTVHTSTDGVTWPASPTYSLATGDYLAGVVYAGGQFVVVGWHYLGTGMNYTGIVLTSPDGATWTDQSATASITTQLMALAYGGGKYVATGEGASVSSDGIHWTPETQGTTDVMSSLAYGGGLFVAIDGTNGTQTYTSPDGMAWTLHQNPSVSLGNGYGTALAYGNGTFLAPSLATSTDGVSWTAHAGPNAQMTTAVYGPVGWVGVGATTTFWTHP